jgi:hypothetical protein
MFHENIPAPLNPVPNNKSTMKTPPKKSQVFQQSVESVIKVRCSGSLVMLRWFVVILAAAIVAACSAHASTNNLLFIWPSGWSTAGCATFEVPSVLAGTGPCTYGTGSWPQGAGTNGACPLYDGSVQLSVGCGIGGSGFAWKTIAAAPNVQYTLTVEGGAQNWWLPTGEIRLVFLDANSAIISSNIVETCLSINNPNASPPVALYDTGVPYQNWTNVATSPVGTAFLTVMLCNPNGLGTAWFDYPYLTAPINPLVPTPLQWGYSAGVLTLSWSNAALHLQAQTNALNGNWSDYPGGETSPVNITPNNSLGDVFFRLSN